jgi:hypothetical protein
MAHSANDMMAIGSITYRNGSTSMRVLVIIAVVFLLIKFGGLLLGLRGSMDAATTEVGAAALDRYASRGTARSGEEHERRLPSEKHRRG